MADDTDGPNLRRTSPVRDRASRFEKMRSATTDSKRLKELEDALRMGGLDAKSSEEALRLVEQMTDDEPRAKALSMLSRHLSEDGVHEAMRVASQIADAKHLAVALNAFSQRLDPRTLAKLAALFADPSARQKFMLVGSVLVFALVVAGLVWVCWFNWMPSVKNWGFDSPEPGFLRGVLAAFGLFYLAVIPFMPLGLVESIVDFWSRYGEVRKQIASAQAAQEEIEDMLSEGDEQGLILLLRYSRKMLGEYYAIAASQAQRSFRYCLVAMWIGFVVLIAGVLDIVEPLRDALANLLPTQTEGAATPTPASTPRSPDDLVILTGAVIEFIAAAFLFVYRFSIKQQTYYYRRQLRLHNGLLAYRMTEKMTQGRDDATKVIVERLLADADTDATNVAPTGASDLAKLLSRTQPNKA